MILDFGGGQDIRFEKIGKAGVVTLTRDRSLNALTHAMVRALAAALEAWKHDDSVATIIVKAEGRAFCAGGDIVDVYRAGREGRLLTAFFADEYRLNAVISAYPKPYVALVNGIVMGGGVGISVHGSHRLFGPKAVFAMPEVGIGFFPDVGGSYFLPRLKGCVGFYLGLTGLRIGQGDCCWAGIATHTAPTESFDDVISELAAGETADKVLSRHHEAAPHAISEAEIASIGRHFSLERVGDIVASLRQGSDQGDELAVRALKAITTKSPTSLEVVQRQLAAGAMLDMDDCMRMEFRILNRMLEGHDFYEGIRAALIDKDGAPQWQPASLDAVDPNKVEAYFAPLGERELEI